VIGTESGAYRLWRMRSWSAPELPGLPGAGRPLRLYDTAAREVRVTGPAGPNPGQARMYVCGVTPYDATHLGHANTYVAFDMVQRVWRDAGHEVHYVQNATDVDDPLLERAERTGVDWRELATAEIDKYRVIVEPPRKDLLALVEVAAQVAHVPMATINLITDTEQHQVATHGFDAAVCGREDSMCSLVLHEGAPVVVPDASQDPRFRDNPFVTGEIDAVLVHET